jgi:outer membrane protein assembly factor BamB
MKKIFFIISILLYQTSFSQIKGPESIAFCSSNGKYYVSSAKSGEIYLFDIKKGEAINFQKVCSGLKFPRGMFALNGKIYVTEAPTKAISIIDSKTGKITEKISLPESSDLNDITIYKGKIYASDLRGNTIWQVNLKTKKVSKFVSINKPNGLFVSDEKLWCITFTSPAKIFSFDLQNNKMDKEFTLKNFLYGDGLQIKNGKLICSTWGENYSNGKVFIFDIQNNKSKIILKNIKGPADLFLDKTGNIIIPLMTENKITLKKVEL